MMFFWFPTQSIRSYQAPWTSVAPGFFLYHSNSESLGKFCSASQPPNLLESMDVPSRKAITTFLSFHLLSCLGCIIPPCFAGYLIIYFVCDFSNLYREVDPNLCYYMLNLSLIASYHSLQTRSYLSNIKIYKKKPSPDSVTSLNLLYCIPYLLFMDRFFRGGYSYLPTPSFFTQLLTVWSFHHNSETAIHEVSSDHPIPQSNRLTLACILFSFTFEILETPNQQISVVLIFIGSLIIEV